jgi:hypothetical protein
MVQNLKCNDFRIEEIVSAEIEIAFIYLSDLANPKFAV